MSVTIDCNHLPRGEETIKILAERFPGLCVYYIKPQRHCTLTGLYSEVIDAVSHLKELLVDFEAPSEESLFCAQEGDRVQKERDKPPSQRHALCSAEDASLHRESRYSSSKVNSVKLSQAQKHFDDKMVEDWVDAVDVEALSLIVEADVFAYLSSRSEEYRSILHNHGVHVVDVTTAGVTTLYLQSNAKFKTGSQAENHMSHARKELSQLYQQVEGNLRRAQIPRSALNLHGEQNAAFKDLESLLPKVLLSFDQTHVYIVGESSEVSHAKQILLFDSPDENLRAKQEISLPPSTSNSYSSISKLETMQVPGASSESGPMTPKMKLPDPERRVRIGEEYKLAARFKNSDMGLLGFGPAERGRTREHQDLPKGMNTLTLNSGSKQSINSSLVTSGTVNSDQARASQVSAIKVTGVNNIGEDVLFQKMEPLSFTSKLKNSSQVSNKVSKTNSVNSTSRVTPAFNAPLSTPLDTFTGLEKLGKTPRSTVECQTTSTSSLRRANSFSGRLLSKHETQKTEINEKSCLATNTFRRPRAGSLNGRMSVEALPSSTASGAVTVPNLMWSYIKEAYQSDLNSLISDLQVTEKSVDKNKTMVILIGSASSKVEECQSELQKLVDMIGTDFCVQNLQLADVSLTEGNDIFKECCLNIFSHFKKIVLQQTKDAIFLIGPKSQCSQANKILKELFLNGFSNSGPLVNIFTHQGSTDQSQANASAKQAPTKSNCQVRPNQTKAITETHAKGRLKGYKFESRNAAYMQSPKPVAKKVLKKSSDLEISKTGPLPGKPSEVSEVLLKLGDDWQKPSSPAAIQKSQKASTPTLKQASLPISKELESCVCGENGAQTSCGVFLCSNCIPLHAQCKICCKVSAARKSSKEMQVRPLNEEQNAEELKRKKADTRQKQKQGIQGTMGCTELSMCLPGYEQYRTAKITYLIPDGIQGEEHPNPGSPFQGGIFEAYLPLSPKGQSLLQCMEKAFKQRLTFTVCPSNNNGRAKTTWSRIPHKTNITGGKSGNGYPDSTYLKDLTGALRTCGIDGV